MLQFLINDDPDLTLFDVGVYHQINVVRFAASVEAEVLPILRRVGQDVVASVQTRVGGLRSSFMLEEIATELRAAIGGGFAEVRKLLEERRQQWGEHETDVWFAVGSRLLGNDLGDANDFVLPAALTAAVFGGKTLDQWVAFGANSAMQRVYSTIRQGFEDGSSSDDIVRGVKGSVASRFTDGNITTMLRQGSMIARTAVTAGAETARGEFTRVNSEAFPYWLYSALLDAGTSGGCRSLHGKVFKQGEGPKPPRHPNCRSASIPRIKRTGQGDETFRHWLGRVPDRIRRDIIGNSDLGALDDVTLRLALYAPRALDQVKLREVLGA